MKRSIAKTTTNLSPAEWDFRTVSESVLHLAIMYEYARSAEWIVDKFYYWHAQRVRLKKASKDLKKLNGKTVAELLSEEELPFEVSQAIAELQPDMFRGSPFSEILDISWHFPAPFLRIQHSVDPTNLKHLAPDRNRSDSIVVLKSFPQDSKRQQESSAKAGLFYFPVKLNLKLGKRCFIAAAEKLFDRMVKEHPEMKRIATGKAGSVPWVQLKELAAYRLDNEGLNATKAKELFAERKKSHPLKDEHDILPLYGHPGWLKAVENASKRIEAFYPAPFNASLKTRPQ